MFDQEKRALKLVLMVATVAVLVIGYMFLSSTLKEPAEFRGIKWGTSIREVPHLKLLGEEGELKFFERENDRMQVGDAPVETIVYGTHRDRLYNVVIYYSLPSNFAKIRQDVSRDFGKPCEIGDSEKRLVWNGEQVTVVLTFDDLADSGRLVYLFKPIQLEIEVSG